MKKINLVAVFCVLSFSLLFGLEAKDPSWVYLKRAENWKDKGDYINAMSEARKAKARYIEEVLEVYWQELLQKHPEETDYELKKLLKQKEQQLKVTDNYPQYHNVMGDLYIQTNFLQEAEAEYKLVLEQQKFLDYPDQVIEVQYKLAALYSSRGNLDLEEMIYREIASGFFVQRNQEYWNRIRYNIREDITLSHAFKIYRLEDGMKYFHALYKIGKREAIAQRVNDSLFYLSCAAIVWMTYFSQEIRKDQSGFQYDGPSQFLNYLNNPAFSMDIVGNDFLMDKVMFYIGYNYFLNREYKIMSHYFDLAIAFADKIGRGNLIRDRVNYLNQNRSHILTYKELLD